MTKDEIVYLIASHLIVSNGEINEKELDALSRNVEAPISDEVNGEQSKIFSDSEDKTSMSWLVSQIKCARNVDYDRLFSVMLDIAFSDDYYDDRERTFINKLAKDVNYPSDRLKRQEYEYGNRPTDMKYTESWNEGLKSSFYRLLAAMGDDEAADSEHELLSGTDFRESICRIASWAKDDLDFSIRSIKEYISFLYGKIDQINQIIDSINNSEQKHDDSAAKLIDQINEFGKSINGEIKDALENTNAVLDKKRRTINYFSIAFMGRTKAGKSTFHKVITHESNDDIGVGKQRTTRFNRSWYWHNLRIIDTPGIGAAGIGGREDEKIARSIVDEADLVCYIVINDSIQETEFNFLKGLKEKNKPLFIILNVKENLEQPIRLKRFLKDPLKWKNDTGDKNIEGHFQRIRECIGDNYNLYYVHIIPVQLLAAKYYYDKSMAFSQEERELLFKGSNISEYIRAIRTCISESGNLKKSQNIVDGCGLQIHNISKKLSEISDDLEKQCSLLSKSKSEIADFISRGADNALEKIRKEVVSAFNKLDNNAYLFAQQNYNARDIGEKWKNYYDNKQIFTTLNDNIGKIANDLSSQISDRLEESLKDVDFSLKMGINSDVKNLKRSNPHNVRIWVNSAGSILAFALGCWNPLGWGAAVVGVATIAVSFIFSGFSSLFKSKEQKRNEAIEKLVNKLKENNREQYPKMLNGISKEFSKNINDLKQKIIGYYDIMLDNSNRLTSQIHSVCRKSDSVADSFSRFFAFRMLQHIQPSMGESLCEFQSKGGAIDAKRSFEDNGINISVNKHFAPAEIEKLQVLTQLMVKYKFL
jgi:GTP-binding protein EngB required for normal cell division